MLVFENLGCIPCNTYNNDEKRFQKTFLQKCEPVAELKVGQLRGNGMILSASESF